jgi:dethiobiotin synthetase
LKRKFPKNIFVTGIGTGVGKTFASAVLCETLQADFWKPIQTGNTETTDSSFIRATLLNTLSKIHQEVYSFSKPASPHFAAFAEGKIIELEKVKLPDTNNRLVVEGAGGLLVPLNDELVMYDLIDYLKLPVVVVVRNYLGSINHALLTCQFLEERNADVLGIIFSGSNYNDNEQTIKHFTQLPLLGNLDETKVVDKAYIQQQAQKMKATLSTYFDL